MPTYSDSSGRLANQRDINGTPFDGLSNIVTNFWGHTRILTIGDVSKPINGSTDITFSLDEIGVASTAHTHKPTEIVGFGQAVIDSLPKGTANKILKHNGTTWVIGDDNDTTYPTLTSALVTAGTSTTAGVISPNVLKEAILTHAPTPTNITGNSETTTKLKTGRKIAGSTFDGTKDIDINRANLIGEQPMDTVTGLVPTLNRKLEVLKGYFVTNQYELELTKKSIPSQRDIFNSWYRFSHNANGLFPAFPDETTAWSFNDSTESFYNTTNSVSAIGMVSIKPYDEYDFEVRIKSTDGDDDMIGVVAAFHIDDSGAEHTICVVRSPGGIHPLWGIVYNFGQSGHGVYTIENGASKVEYGDNINNTTLGWSQLPAFYGTDGTCLIRVERRGNIINAYTSQWGTPDKIDPNTKITADLTSSSKLSKFIGGSGYGVVAKSQKNSYWQIVEFSSPSDYIYDLSTNTTYIFDGTDWVPQTPATKIKIKPDTLIYNDLIKTVWYHPYDVSNMIRLTPKIEPDWTQISHTSTNNLILDLTLTQNFKINASSTFKFGKPGNLKPNQSGWILLTTTSSVTSTITWDTVWKFAGSKPTFTGAKTWYLTYNVIDENTIIISGNTVV